MKRTNRVIAALVAVMMVMALLAGCGNSGGSSSAVGTWTAKSVEAQGMTLDPSAIGVDITFELKSDGSLEASVSGETVTGTWSQSGNTVTITIDDESQDAALDGNKLSMEIEGTKVTFER